MSGVYTGIMIYWEEQWRGVYLIFSNVGCPFHIMPFLSHTHMNTRILAKLIRNYEVMFLVMMILVCGSLIISPENNRQECCRVCVLVYVYVVFSDLWLRSVCCW